MQLLSVLLLGACLAALAAPQERPKPREVDVAGCVQAGVEAGCVMLVTTDGHKYHLLADKEKLPGLGSFVQVKGTAGADVISFCMEGEPLQVKEVRLLEKKCPRPGREEK
jgi:hypothetical protein